MGIADVDTPAALPNRETIARSSHEARHRIDRADPAFDRAQQGKGFGMRFIAAATLLASLLPFAAQAQGSKDSTTAQAGRIASRPAYDVGLAKRKVPPVLQRAAAAPYAKRGTATCGELRSGIRALSDALGIDFSATAKVSNNKAGQIAKLAGETVVNSIIPFRGVVREISGAAAAQRRLQAATYAGLARRGFLRGLYTARRCRPRL